MRYKAMVFAVLLGIVFSVSASGQTPAPPGPAPLSVDLPTGDHAWAVRVVRSGGLVGGLFLDITIRFDGEVTIDSGSGKRNVKLAANELNALSPLVMTPGVFLTESQLDYGCSDCYVTAITVRRREPDGKDRKYSGFWSPTTAALPSPELVQIAATILSIKF